MRETLRRLPGIDILRELRERSYFYKRNRLNPNGFAFVGNRKMQYGSFENDIVFLIKKLAKERDYKNFVDIGAHHGYFSCLAHTLGLNVYSVEPNPVNYSILKRNFRSNNMDKAYTLNVALGNTNSEIEMFGFGTGFSIHKHWARDVSNIREKVTMRTLDDLEIELSNSLIKIDVEGAETLVLKGGLNKLRFCKNTFVIVEVSDVTSRTSSSASKNSATASAVQILVDQGFSLIDLNEDGELLIIPEEDQKKFLDDKVVNGSANLFFQKLA